MFDLIYSFTIHLDFRLCCKKVGGFPNPLLLLALLHFQNLKLKHLMVSPTHVFPMKLYKHCRISELKLNLNFRSHSKVDGVG